MTRKGKRVFPDIDRKKIVVNEPLEKYSFCYPVLRQCLINELEKRNLVNLSEIARLNRIGLYAVNEFMDYMIVNMKELDIGIRVYDRNFEAFSEGYKGYEVRSYENAVYDCINGVIDKIVICNLTHGTSIAESFLTDGVSGKDIRLVDMIVYGME